MPVAAHRWNLIPYLTDQLDPTCADDIATAMAAIDDSVDIVLDDNGRMWIPQEGINTIGAMNPYKAYRIFLRASGDLSLCYPHCTFGPPLIQGQHAKAAPKPQVQPVETGRPQAVVFTAATPGILTPGDEVRLYDGEVLVGVAVYTGALPLACAVWEGDPSHHLPGFTSGHPISVRLWDHATGRVSPVDVFTEQGEPASFAFHPYARLALGADAGRVISEFRLLSLRPVPTRERVEVRYQIPQPAEVRLDIFDVAGRLVRTLQERKASSGVFSIAWDGTDARGHRAGSGTYFARLQAGSAHAQRRLLVVR